MPKENRMELRAIMHRGNINTKQTADLIGVSMYTVIAWLKPPTSKSSSPMPDHMLRLLNFILNK